MAFLEKILNFKNENGKGTSNRKKKPKRNKNKNKSSTETNENKEEDEEGDKFQARGIPPLLDRKDVLELQEELLVKL
ncbi:hypothetical protein Tco_0666228, partial [Tanacetum coccineum]